jgi:regulation of enolase protein 1 (concanavalin A-like superfamily)
MNPATPVPLFSLGALRTSDFGLWISRRLRLLASLVFALLAAETPARWAVLETRTGQVYEGLARLESNAVVVVNVERNLLVRIPATNLFALTFRTRADTPAGPPLTAGSASGELPPPWRSEDIGSVQMAGNATAFAGFFTVRSSGTHIGGRSDSFHFIGKPVLGRSDLLVRVQFVQYTHPSAQAGLMMRESLSAGAPNVFVGLTPRRTGFVQWRSTEGGMTATEPRPELHTPRWLRLKRDGPAFAAYASLDGRQWSLLHTASVQMAEAIYVGLAVASGRGDRLHTSTFDRVQEAPWLWTSPHLPRIELQSGSSVMGLIRAVDDTAVRFWGAPPREPVPRRAVSRIVFQWLGARDTTRLPSGKPGVLLRNGEFIESECRSLQDGVLQVSSVLLGLRRFDVEGEVAALLLRKPEARPAGVAVRTLDGSIWLGQVIGLGEGEVLVQDAALGLCRLPVYDLAEVRWRK